MIDFFLLSTVTLRNDNVFARRMLQRQCHIYAASARRLYSVHEESPSGGGDEWMARSNSDNPHQRTRNDHATETAEDYVEAIDGILSERGICRSSDLAERFAVSHVTVHRIVSRLQDDGLLITEPYQPLRLTRKGKRVAKRSRERHELVYEFLLAIGVDPETAAKDAEGIEHHVSAKTLEQFRRTIKRLG